MYVKRLVFDLEQHFCKRRLLFLDLSALQIWQTTLSTSSVAVCHRERKEETQMTVTLDSNLLINSRLNSAIQIKHQVLIPTIAKWVGA